MDRFTKPILSPQTPPLAPKELAAFSRRAQSITASLSSTGVTVPAIVDLLAKLSRLAGVSHEANCIRCLDDAKLVPIVTEMFGIREGIREIPESARAGLLKGEGCPFRTENGCLLGHHKPLQCRPKNQAEQARIIAVEHGHQVGLALLGLAHYRVHLTSELPNTIADANNPESGALKAFSEGYQIFRENAAILPSRDLAIEEAKMIRGKREPSGSPIQDPNMVRACTELPQIPLETVLQRLPRQTDHQRLFSLRVPFAYSSEDEIDTWRERFLGELDEFIARGYDPVNVIDGLVSHETFAIAYQGRNARELLEPYGQRLVDPAMRAAMPDLTEPIDKRRKGKIRVGYIGRHLRNHNGGVWALGWARNHGEDIQTIALPLYEKPDQVTEELREICDEFYPLLGDVAHSGRFIKSLNLDVLIYTDIGMDGVNTMYAAMRLAPVQCTAWGHPVTSGLPNIDYYLSSELMEPPDAETHYTERLIRLPGSGLFYSPRIVPPSAKSKAEFGLEDGPLFLMPNNPLKMIPRWDYLFAELSQSVGRPIVFLEGYQSVATPILKERFAKAGILSHWLPTQPANDYLQLVALADLVLDPPAWSGGNTTLEAFRYRRPVLTMPGEFMRGRHGLAFLSQAGMPSLIAKNPKEYLKIASDPGIWESAIAGANWAGPFEDKQTTLALDAWIREVARG